MSAVAGCVTCSAAWHRQLVQAAEQVALKLWVPYGPVRELLHMWWTEALQ